MDIGTIVKLSGAGLDHIYKYNPKGRVKAEQLKFEFRGYSRQYKDVVVVKRLTSDSWLHYHESFIELA